MRGDFAVGRSGDCQNFGGWRYFGGRWNLGGRPYFKYFGLKCFAMCGNFAVGRSGGTWAVVGTSQAVFGTLAARGTWAVGGTLVVSSTLNMVGCFALSGDFAVGRLAVL